MTDVERRFLERCERLMLVIKAAARAKEPTPTNAELSFSASLGGSDGVKPILDRLVAEGRVFVESHDTRIAVRRFVLPDGTTTDWTIIKNRAGKAKRHKSKSARELLAMIKQANPTLTVWINEQGEIQSEPKYKGVPHG